MGFLDVFDPNEIKQKKTPEARHSQTNKKVMCYACGWNIFEAEAEPYRGEGYYICALCKQMTHYQLESLAALNNMKK